MERIYGPKSDFFPSTSFPPWVPLCRIAPELACSAFEYDVFKNPMHELELRGFVQTENRRTGITALESTRHGPYDYLYRTSFGERVRVCFVDGWALIVLPDRFPKGIKRIPAAAKALLDEELKRSATVNETCHLGRKTGPLCAAARLDADQRHYKLTPLGLQTMFPWPAPIPIATSPQAELRMNLLGQLNTTESLIVEIVFRHPGLTGEKIASRIDGQQFNGTFKGIMSGLRRGLILKSNRGGGYTIETSFSEPVREWLSHLRKSGQSPD